jgi:hypothetical protein
MKPARWKMENRGKLRHMTRLFLITLLVLSGGPAYAEWVEVDRNDQAGMTVYVDPDTIRHEGDLVKMWELFDHKTTQNIGVGLFMSRKDQREYDCSRLVESCVW